MAELSLAPAKRFQDLIVWQRAHQSVLAIYRLTSQFPIAERYGLIAQLRRAAISIPANIAEGFKRIGRQDKARFMNIAQGSLEECRYYLILCKDLSYADGDACLTQLDEVSRILESYVSTLRRPTR